MLFPSTDVCGYNVCTILKYSYTLTYQGAWLLLFILNGINAWVYPVSLSVWIADGIRYPFSKYYSMVNSNQISRHFHNVFYISSSISNFNNSLKQVYDTISECRDLLVTLNDFIYKKWHSPQPVFRHEFLPNKLWCIPKYAMLRSS